MSEETNEGLTLREVVGILEAEVLAGHESLDTRVVHGFGADMMSDVLAMVKPRTLLLTGQATAHAVRTAGIAEAVGIVFVRGKRPAPEVIALAREMGMPLIITGMIMFEACGKLFENSLKP